jgi:thiamine pyrophosphate-dependent acetolactate synthase large subunit-like protein
MTVLSGGGAVAASLAAHGVDQVWGIPGTHNLELYAQLGPAGIGHAPARHEQGAAFAADGYARASGRVGVCVTTSGPAVLNAATALAQAWSDSIPVLLVSPGMPLRHPGRGNGYLHEAKDLHGAMQAIVAASQRVTSVQEIPTAVAQAFATMTSGRPRPVHLEVPLDIMVERAEVELVAPVASPAPAPDAVAVAAAVAVLAASERPAIIAGGGAAGASGPLAALAERLRAPLVTSFNGKGCLGSGHPLCMGTGLHRECASALVGDCDALLVVGCELAPADLWNGPLPSGPAIVRVDIDPLQAVTNAAPAVSLVGDAALALEALLGGLGAEPQRPDGGRARRWRAAFAAEAATETDRWGWILDPLAEAVGEHGVVAGDSAKVCYYGAAVRLPAQRPRSFLYPTGFGTLGYGLPAGVGAKLARPDDPVAVLIGDGGLMFTLGELAAAAQQGLALPVVVVDNGGYGEIRDEMLARGDAPLGVETGAPDFAALAIALGCHGVRADDAPALARALAGALAADRPTVIHVRGE